MKKSDKMRQVIESLKSKKIEKKETKTDVKKIEEQTTSIAETVVKKIVKKKD